MACIKPVEKNEIKCCILTGVSLTFLASGYQGKVGG